MTKGILVRISYSTIFLLRICRPVPAKEERFNRSGSTIMKGTTSLKKKDGLSALLSRYGHAWVFAYAPIYLIWFGLLEQRKTSFVIVHSVLDDLIPFCELFIIPYLLWFAYMAVCGVYFFLHEKQEFYQLAFMLITGMTIFLIFCTLVPNGHFLRPVSIARNNFFIQLVRMIWRVDTPTNVLPSLHVYNSLACHMAVSNCKALKDNKLVVRSSFLLAALIIASTMFLKQHSVVDVFCAFAMANLLKGFVYEEKPQHSLWHKTA